MITNNINSIRPIRADFISNKISPQAKAQNFGAKIPSPQQSIKKSKSFFSLIFKFLKIDDLVKNSKLSQSDKLKKASKITKNTSDTTTIHNQKQVRKKKKIRRGSLLVPSVDIYGSGKNGSYINLRKYEKTDNCPPRIRLTRYNSNNECANILEEIEISPNKVFHSKFKDIDGHHTSYYHSEKATSEEQQMEKWFNLAKKLISDFQKRKPAN